MKTAHILYSSIMAVALLSCTKEEPGGAVGGEGAVQMLWSANAAYGASAWQEGDVIAVSAFRPGSGEFYDGVAHRRYRTPGDGAFFPLENEDKIIYPMNGDAVDLFAYYPYNAAVTGRIYDVDLRDQSSQRAIDLLYSNNVRGRSKHTAEVGMEFHHPLSKIVVGAVPGDGMTEEELLGMVVSLENVTLRAAFDLADGSLLPYGEAGSSVMHTDALRSEAIVLPVWTHDTGIVVTLADAGVYRAALPDADFMPGVAHHYRMSVNRTGIEITPLEIADWEGADEEQGSGSTAVTIYEVGDYYPDPSDPVTAIGVVYWLSPGSEGRNGKAISFDSANRVWSTDNTRETMVGSIVSGASNMNVVLSLDPTLQSFPAFRWCADKGDGWYLPGRYELHILREQWGRNEEAINRAIETAGGEPLAGTDIYLSSSESRSFPVTSAALYDFVTKTWPAIDKTTPQRIRAVIAF